ncbi:MAG: CBS domain-containing protein [Alphaproteobacteria bacterium]|uniref:GHMP family kinase ATP-binding protein n=2 Tax=Alphaproteobacteria TaxID=28211 RepID=UPI003265EFD2
MTFENMKDVLLHESATLRDAMSKLKASGAGIVVVTDDDGCAIGVLSDGDIRTAVLATENLDTAVSKHMTQDFVWVAEGASKERVLKLFDRRIRTIPILDSHRRPIGLAVPGYMAPIGETISRARAPVRLSLAGGGTDFTHHFLKYGGNSLSTTMARYCRATLRKREDSGIRIHSRDLGRSVQLDRFDDIVYDGNLDLIKAAIKVLRPTHGFDLEISSDVQPGTGLGGSAAILAAVIGCFSEFREDYLDDYTIAEYAYEAERVELEIAGGWQDQYSTVFGGFNFIDFNAENNIVTPLRITTRTRLELEERFLLCYTGNGHMAATIQDANRARAGGDPSMVNFAEQIKPIAIKMRMALLKGHLDDLGTMLHETWNLKKRINPGGTSSYLDKIYDTAMKAGADGGRLLGTGGGGYFLFFCKPYRRGDVVEALERKGHVTENVLLDQDGLQTWTTHS